ncbi:MAG TPA: LLM class flavin-dependent oxidoreductase [Baekduia sp.]|nr:LLM class flavin-dependent oxidoreductase [Baekduia sp.]
MTAQRQLHLNAFLMSSGHHEAAWRLPESNPHADFDVAHWTRLAQLAERGKLDSLFLADGPALWHSGEFRPAGALDPLILLTILAAATERIGLIATASTTYNSPYNLARRFSSLDHVSGGRAGWNIVTTASRGAAQNFGLEVHPDPAARYARATEFLDVTLKLWDSWEDDAAFGDKRSGRYADPRRIHPIGHHGEHFRVEGPLNAPRSPQGYPLLVQAGSSTAGRALAARYAEAIFTAQQTLADGQGFYADIKRQAAAIGRDPDGVKVLPGIVPVLGDTEAAARERALELEELIVPEYSLYQLAEVLEVPVEILALDRELPAEIPDPDEASPSRPALIVSLARRESLTVRELIARLGGGRGHRTVVGTPEQIADNLQSWFENGAADGFNVMGSALPRDLEDFIEQVVPILRARGLFRSEYTGRTLRDHYGLPRPQNQFATASTTTKRTRVRLLNGPQRRVNHAA